MHRCLVKTAFPAILCTVYMRNSKILATLGPTSDTEEQIGKLLDAGANAFRLNFSHGSHEEHARRIGIIRKLEKERDVFVSIVADLQGAKLRIGAFADEGGVNVSAGESFDFYLEDRPGDVHGVSLMHPEIFEVAEKDMSILVEDGLLRFRVTDVSSGVLKTVVVVGGRIKSHKGVNVPTVQLPVAALTEKDKEDLDFALSQEVDWIALSFVQRPEDVIEARDIIRGRAGVIAKIEKPSAVESIDEIIPISDAIMIARGDLGVEMPAEDVPIVQKRIITKCRRAGKLVIVATQMLDSMIRSPVPTRAEVSDVANALYDGTDVVMLSGETASGKYPFEAVSMMRNVLNRTEDSEMFESTAGAVDLGVPGSKTDAVAWAAHRSAQYIDAKVLVVFSSSGNTARRCARYRPACPLLCLTPNTSVARRLSLSWGVGDIHVQDLYDFDETVRDAVRIVSERGFAKKGDPIVITTGAPFEHGEGKTNTMTIVSV